MTVDDITKENFIAFVNLQRSNAINMTDIVTGARMLNITEAAYETIIFNYRELKNKFITKKKN